MTINGVVYNITDGNSDGTFEGGSVVVVNSEVTPDLIAGAFSGDGVFDIGIGFLTNPATLEAVSTGSYFSAGGSYLESIDDADPTSVLETATGDAAFTIDFATNEVTGTPFDNGFFILSIENGTIDADGNITGTLSLERGGTPLDINSTGIDAAIFGADAEMLGGTFEAAFDDDSFEDDRFFGIFEAQETTPIP